MVDVQNHVSVFGPPENFLIQPLPHEIRPQSSLIREDVSKPEIKRFNLVEHLSHVGFKLHIQQDYRSAITKKNNWFFNISIEKKFFNTNKPEMEFRLL